ncbi:hypothetical protein LTR12_013862 [Friedmanniomyces endolithicus]|nr:hypothetical protein LTR12_013862 [Friedmanniomyces endolithicus]
MSDNFLGGRNAGLACKRALFRLERARGVVTVGMNDVQFCDFRQTVKAIGTRDLKGCHVVIVVSGYGAVLGHISPRSGRQQPGEVHGGDNHIDEQMQRLKTVYESFKARNFFPQSGSGTHTIHAMLNGEIALPDQKELIERHLMEMGLPRPTSFSYNVDLHANANADSSKGTVLLLGNSSPPTLLVEDSVVFPQARTQPVTQARQTSQATGSSSGPGLSAATNFTG